jgi:hypothetical protein
MLFALRRGLELTFRSWGLVVLLLAINVLVAAILAIPLAQALEAEFSSKESGSNMMYGFDYAWWSHWSDTQPGWTRTLGPDILGTGFAFKNVDLLLKGRLPAGLLQLPSAALEDDGGSDDAPVGGVILALGVLYLVLQTFLAGGLLGVLRAAQGEWTLRGLLHGSGFYFGRLARIALIALSLALLLFWLNAPFARWADDRAREAVSESTAMAWTVGRHAVLLLALLFLNMLSSYAKVIVVLEERSSAVLAWLSALSFCLANFARSAGHYLALGVLWLLLLGAWSRLDGAWQTVGYWSQLPTFLLLQALVAARIALRVALLGGQLALYRRDADAV